MSRLTSKKCQLFLGRDILNNGNWNGNQLMTDSIYFNEMVNSSQTLNYSYGYLWWLNGKQSYMVPQSQIVFPNSICSNAPSDMIVAMGKGGQFLNIVPSQHLVWLRMGDEPNNSLVPFLLNNDIWAYVNDLQCTTTGSESHEFENSYVQLFPNPGSSLLNVISNKQIQTLDIFTIQGHLVKTSIPSEHFVSISINDLANGLYFVKAGLANENVWTGKFIKE